MPVERLMHLLDTDESLMVLGPWRDLPETDDTLKPMESVFQNFSQLFRKILGRKNALLDLVQKPRRELHL